VGFELGSKLFTQELSILSEGCQVWPQMPNFSECPRAEVLLSPSSLNSLVDVDHLCGLSQIGADTQHEQRSNLT
jgi:hypothetical protein